MLLRSHDCRGGLYHLLEEEEENSLTRYCAYCEKFRYSKISIGKENLSLDIIENAWKTWDI